LKRDRIFALLALLAGASLCSITNAQTSAQAPLPPRAASPAGGRVISGTVVNEKTGLPVSLAKVTLIVTKDRSPAGVAITDSEGRFIFSGLSDGKYSLNASHRGYAASAFEAHGTVSTAIVTGADQVTTGLTFALPPQAVIYGTITDDSGDPVAHAQVLLFLEDKRFGSGKIQRAGTAQADDSGNYEFAHLNPGSYFVAAMGTPWYAIVPTIPVDANGKPLQNPDERPRSALDVAFPVAYYPDASDSASASPISAAAGDRVPINVTLHAVPAVKIKVHDSSGSADNRIYSMQLNQEIFGIPIRAPAYSMYPNPGGTGVQSPTAEFFGVAPGHYTFETGAQSAGSRVTTVDAQSENQTLDLSSASALGEISGKVKMTNAAKQPEGLFIMLRPEDGAPESQYIAADGAFHFRDLRPGPYEVQLAAKWVIAITRMTARGGGVQGHTLAVGNDPVVVSITAAESQTTLSGFAKLNGKPASGVFILLVPADPGAGHEDWSANQCDSDGSFDFPQTVPGNYTLVAIEEGWTLDWANREAIAPYLARGLKITVPPNSPDIHLKDPVQVQQK
jgi:Carboxypeptidase regulatory-like domain